MRKAITILTFLCSMCIANSVYGGELVQGDEGVWYQNDDGTWKTGWYQEEGGNWYFFEENGYARKQWLKEDGKQYYFRADSGTMIADRTITLEGKVYQFDHNGVSRQLSDSYTGWMLDDVNWYYRLSDGSFVKDTWKQIKGTWYYFDQEGYMKQGPLTIDGVLYYLDDSGAMVQNGERLIEGIRYAFDETGAGTADWPYKAPLFVPPESEKSDFHKSVDAMADSVLAGIISPDMNQRQKATAIYHWVKGNLRYNGYSPVGDWVGAAQDGLRKRRGDCYTYYATTAELLNRAGFQTIEVIRSSDNNHYWNLVNVDGAWYHIDPCPRRNGGDFCLLTDTQIGASRAHVFDRSLYPPTP